MAYTQLKSRHTPNARVEEISRESTHYRLSIPSGFSESYRLAQLDDYAPFARRGLFTNRAPLRLSLSARASSDTIAGTWGFGLWNDPFGLSLGFGGNPLRLPALPNAVWFFGASQENYLSFRDDKPAQGFLAQTFRSPKFHPWMIAAGLMLPFSRRMARWLLSRVIEEDGVQLWKPHQQAGAQSQGVDPTQWHRYRLDWSLKRVSFEVDEVPVFESPVSPNPPLGLVIWIDNQYAAFTPEGKIAMGVLEGKEAWLEIKDLVMRET
jgi:hypothetical protein